MTLRQVKRSLRSAISASVVTVAAVAVTAPALAQPSDPLSGSDAMRSYK